MYDNLQICCFIKSQKYTSPVYLFMSSGDFNGFDLDELV